MSRFEVARKIKKLNPDVKVVLITAFEINKSEFEKVMPDLKIDNFIAKPFHVSELVQVVNSL
jgi:response regulator RpfG family c-di-GMP phosphodiesterase